MLIAYVVIEILVTIILYRSLQPEAIKDYVAVIAAAALWPATLLFLAFAPDR